MPPATVLTCVPKLAAAVGLGAVVVSLYLTSVKATMLGLGAMGAGIAQLAVEVGEALAGIYLVRVGSHA